MDPTLKRYNLQIPIPLPTSPLKEEENSNFPPPPGSKQNNPSPFQGEK
jgi:hypothetical protein